MQTKLYTLVRPIILPIDRFINGITMYRLTLYSLSAIALYAIMASVFGLLTFSPLSLLGSLALLFLVSYNSNLLFAKIFKAPTNAESSAITALIIFLIASPIGYLNPVSIDIFALILIATVANFAKYWLALHKKHIFNPAAIAVFLCGLLPFIDGAIWWIGSLVMLPVVAIASFLVVRKIRRFTMVGTFLITAFLISVTVNQINFGQANMLEIFASWPLIFFAGFMLTEPLTTPPRRKLQVYYALIIAIFASTPFVFGPLYTSPELALIIGNLFAYIVSPKQRLMLHLIDRTEVASQIFHFNFRSENDQSLRFTPGQYLEWTLPHEHIDSRGNRRYFTIASSPTEKVISIGVKILPETPNSPDKTNGTAQTTHTATTPNTTAESKPAMKSSSFKNHLREMARGDTIVASQVAGDFIMPKDPSIPLVFIAGGIGVTPFRSMIKYLLDTGEKRDICLFYSCLDPKELAYIDIFESASAIGVKFLPMITDPKKVPADWYGVTGFLNKEILEKNVPAWQYRTYYLSGPNIMVESYKKMLTEQGIPSEHIKTDYFPGF